MVCGRMIEGPWVTNDLRMAEFFERLAICFPGASPPGYEAFRLQCEQREFAGRDRFGFRYLARNNIAEATEEAADGLLYCYLEQLKMLRTGESSDADTDLLQAAYHFALAHAQLQNARARAAGSPIAAISE